MKRKRGCERVIKTEVDANGGVAELLDSPNRGAVIQLRRVH